MKQTVNYYDFRRAFGDMDRHNNFSRDGLTTLFEYLENWEEETGEEMELDVIAICCDFSEYANWEEFAIDFPDIDSMEELEENTAVINIEGGGFIIQSF